MKIKAFLFIILFSSIFIFVACDKVEPPFTTENQNGGTSDTVRKLLFEDFTGHKCVNCPAAHVMIEDLQKVYGNRIVVLGIHTGFFATPSASPWDYDFRTTDGTSIGQFFGANSASLPKGMVNRSKVNGNYLIDRAEFGTAVSLVLDSMPLIPELYIELDPNYNSSDSSISVNAKVTALSSMPAGKYNLCIVVTENGIIKPQKNSDELVGETPEILDYHHNNVFRGAINSTWGQEIYDGAIAVNQTFTKSYTGFKIGTDWKVQDLTIVAFVYFADGANDKVVIQAQQVKL